MVSCMSAMIASVQRCANQLKSVERRCRLERCRRVIAVWQGLDGVFAAQDIEEGTAHAHVFIQSGGRNLIRLGVDGECQAMLRFPSIDVLDEQHTPCESGVPNATRARERERRFDRTREADAVTPGERKLLGTDARHSLDIFPDDRWGRVDDAHVLYYAQIAPG